MPDHLIDLRSDTVTHPTPEMRRAMADAPVGDDVFGEDPTVNALEWRAAELTGKDAGLFVPSGTMGNLVSLMAHAPRGGEIVTHEGSHTFQHEAANAAVVVGASTRTLPWDPATGRMDLERIRAAFRDPSDDHEPITSAIVLEDTHSDSMAQPLPADYVDAVAAIAHERGAKLHIDGARLFNAVVSLGQPASRLLANADSASFCLSKGLACPVGSVVVGDADFIRRARRARKLVGGGMRQAGVLAAAGLIALRDGPGGMIERLAEDHANARRLGEALAEMPGITSLDPSRIRANFVLFRVAASDPASPAAARSRLELRTAFLDALRARGVLMIDYSGDQVIRAVPHYGIDASDIERVILETREVLAEIGVARTSRREAPSRPVAASTHA